MNHCAICGNNIPNTALECYDAGYGNCKEENLPNCLIQKCYNKIATDQKTPEGTTIKRIFCKEHLI
jgi:hypothetical protein